MILSTYATVCYWTAYCVLSTYATDATDATVTERTGWKAKEEVLGAEVAYVLRTLSIQFSSICTQDR